MRKPTIYVINGVQKTIKDIAAECSCSAVTALLYFNNHPYSTDTENFKNLKEKLNKRNFIPGYVSLQTIAQKTHTDRRIIFEFIKTIPDGKYSILMKTTKRNLPMLMLKTVELTGFIKELRDFKQGKTFYFPDPEPKAKKKESEELPENLEELKKEHPLVKDHRFFKINYFPKIDSYEYLTECNTEGGYL